MTKPADMTLSVGIDLQRMYDETVALRDSLTAQIESMEKSGRVCKHRPEERAMETLSNGPNGIPVAVCTGCNTWVPTV